MMPHARSYKEYTEGALPRIYLAGHLPLFSSPSNPRGGTPLTVPTADTALSCCCSLTRPIGLGQDQHDQEQEQSTELQPGIKVVSNEAR